MSTRSALVLALASAGLLAAAPASAQEWGVSRTARQPAPPRHHVGLRAGASSYEPTRPELCLDVEPARGFSLEMCGTGSGILHNDPDPQLMHTRAKLTFARQRAAGGWLESRFGIGFAELQIGEDDPGFRFTDAGPRGVETAGPEAGVFLRWLKPARWGIEFVVELSLSVGWLPYAGELVIPVDPVQPSFSATAGFGF